MATSAAVAAWRPRRPVDGHGVSFQECAGGVAMKGLCCACLPGGGRQVCQSGWCRRFSPSPQPFPQGRGKQPLTPYLYCVRRYCLDVGCLCAIEDMLARHQRWGMSTMRDLVGLQVQAVAAFLGFCRSLVSQTLAVFVPNGDLAAPSVPGWRVTAAGITRVGFALVKTRYQRCRCAALRALSLSCPWVTFQSSSAARWLSLRRSLQARAAQGQQLLQ